MVVVKGSRPDDGEGNSGRNGPRGYLRYFHLGTQMAVTIVLGVFGGMWLDGRWGTSPILTVVGSVLGIGLGMGVVIREVGRIHR
jgi:ATP synthase protein I